MSKRYEEASSVPMFCEFFDAVLHSFLYSRGLYPLRAFALRKRYGVPIQVCVHPEVKDYVDSVSRSLAAMLDEHRMERIEVVVIDTRKDFVKEKLVVEPMSLPRFEVASLTVDELFRLEQHLRAALLKILQSFRSLVDLRMAPNCTWKVRVLAKTAVYLDLLEKQKTSGELFWHFDDEDEDSQPGRGSGGSDNNVGFDKDANVECNVGDNGGDDDGPFAVIPLRNIKSKFMEVHLHLEDYSCQEL